MTQKLMSNSTCIISMIFQYLQNVITIFSLKFFTKNINTLNIFHIYKNELTSISLTTINNHFKSFKAQTFNFHLFCFHYTPTKLHFFSFSFHFHLKPLRTFIFIDPILYFGDFHQKNRQKVFFCSCSKFGR